MAITKSDRFMVTMCQNLPPAPQQSHSSLHAPLPLLQGIAYTDARAALRSHVKDRILGALHHWYSGGYLR